MNALHDKLRNGVDLTAADVRYATTILLSEKANDDEKAEFLTALHQKGESADEILAFVQVLMERAIDPEIDPQKLAGPMIDVCGTGGDGLDFFNVSTTIMFVLAAGGAAVVKHGNRSVTSQCGSADVLEELGVPVQLEPEALRQMLEEHNAAFVFARWYHPAFRALAQMRERLARQNQRTVFNLLGPLLNPARPSRQLIGVFSPRLTTLFADVLQRLGRTRAWVVHGLADRGNGMDDVSVTGATTVAELEHDRITSAVLDTQWLGLGRWPLEELYGGDRVTNAKIITGILSGEVKGAKRDMTLANAAAGFVVAGLVQNMNHGIELAREQIDSGRALAKLRAMQKFRRQTD